MLRVCITFDAQVGYGVSSAQHQPSRHRIDKLPEHGGQYLPGAPSSSLVMRPISGMRGFFDKDCNALHSQEKYKEGWWEVVVSLSPPLHCVAFVTAIALE